MSVRPRRLLSSLLFFCAGVLAAGFVSAQPADGYIGPELRSEPQPGGNAKSGRGGGGWYGDWQFCAGEGERCTVRGWGVVRYGTDGRYYYREVRNASLFCDNTMFGDPAPRRGKRCEVRLYEEPGHGSGPGYADAGWQRCAREDETCQVNGRAVVRFGTDGRYYERPVRGGPIYCSVETFGDPAPRKRKYCDIRYEGGQGGIGDGGAWQGGGNAAGPWEWCAGEGEVCRLPGPATVRYGSDGRYHYERFRGGSVRCDNRTFGDPAPRRGKGCEFQREGGHGGGWSDGGSGRWVVCAHEGGYCDFSGRRAVRYGADDGRYVVRQFRGGVECSNAAFGEDPAPRRRTSCALED
jgi:hypothetical protein